MRLLILVSLWSLAFASTSWAEYVTLPVKCVRDDGRLFLERSDPASLQIIGSTSQRPYTVCAPKNGRHCRTIEIHKFDVMCAGQRIAWRDVAATIIRQRGATASVSDGRLKFKLAKKKTFASLNANCSSGRKASGSKASKNSSVCSRKGYVPRGAIELPSGFAPLAEVGGYVSVNPVVSKATRVHREPLVTEAAASKKTSVPRSRIPLAGNRPSSTVPKHIRLASVGRTTMTLPGEGSVTDTGNEPRAAGSKPSPASSENLRQAAATEEKLTAVPESADAAPEPAKRSIQKPVQVAAAGKSFVATTPENSWSASVSEALKTNFTAVTKSGPQMQQSLIATVIGLALITSLISGIGWFATQQLLSLRTRSTDPYQLILRREVVDLAKPDAQMCGELCRTGQGLIGDIQGRVGDIKGAAPLRRVLLREVRSMEQFLATTIQTAPDDPREWRRMRLRLQRVVTDLIRLKDITDGARRSLTSRSISEELPRDKQEAYEVLGANPEASEKILKRLVDALRATWHPDLASNDDDRELRDRRIKQINVAWDLITDKRGEA